MALELDLACQFVLNRYDLEIEKMRLSVRGVPEDAKQAAKLPATPSSAPKSNKPQRQTMIREDIMRNYK